MSVLNTAFPSTTKLPLVARPLLRIKRDISMTEAISTLTDSLIKILCSSWNEIHNGG
jgi:hypothetical protein